jgi:hypothetical protein
LVHEVDRSFFLQGDTPVIFIFLTEHSFSYIERLCFKR